MALAPGEYWSGGKVYAADGSLAVTTSLVGATWWGGFLRDPDGRLVVVYF